MLRGHLRKQRSETGPKAGSPDSKATQKEIGAEDVCPICQEELLGKPLPLTFCKFGCGNSVHIKCMKIWAEHQQSNGETTVRCPLCRENFGSIQVSARLVPRLHLFIAKWKKSLVIKAEGWSLGTRLGRSCNLVPDSTPYIHVSRQYASYQTVLYNCVVQYVGAFYCGHLRYLVKCTV